MYKYSSRGRKFLHSVVFESIYASSESSWWDFQSISVKTSMFLKSGFVDNWLTVFDHANSLAPLMDAICPRRFLIEYVDAK